MRIGRGIWVSGLLAVVGVSSPLAISQSVDLDDVVLFAGGNLTFNSFSTIHGGAVVAVGDITHNDGILKAGPIFGEAGFDGGESDGFQDFGGPAYFNGDIVDLGGPGSTFGGNITSANGGVFFSSSSNDVIGDVMAAGNVALPSSFTSVYGNILAGGDVQIAGDVAGNVTHGGSFTAGFFAEVDGTVSMGGPVAPIPFVAPSLPAASIQIAGTNDIDLSSGEDITLQPGVYGSLNFASGNTVSLSAGSYVFADINSDFPLNELSFDTSSGPIDIFLANPDASFDHLIQSINGESLFAGGEPDPAAASEIMLEVAGSLTLADDFYGTVFAPNGDITVGGAANDVVGRIWAGGDVVLGNVDLNVISTIRGDFNTDGFVSQADLDMILLNWGSSVLPDGLNQDALVTGGVFDGVIGQNELDDVLLSWGRGTPPGLSTIPEPSVAALVSLGGLVMMRRRAA